jgi:hypothetical protein
MEGQRYFKPSVFWSKFHLNSPEFRTEKKSNEISSILFNNRNCEEIDKREKFFILSMHSNTIEY